MDLPSIGWGIIGCGDVTERKSGPALRNIPGSSVVTVMRRDAAKAEDYARRHGVAEWTTDADAVINHPGVTAVYVATPPDTHTPYALRALAAGKPVYIEKPMARTYGECLEVVAASRRTGLPAYVAFYRRALPHFEAIRGLLNQGALGTVLSVRLHLVTTAPGKPEDAWRWQKEVAGGGLLWDLGSHQLDLLDWWLGPISKVHGIRKSRAGIGDVEDVAAAAMEFASGPLLSAHWCFAAEPAARQDVIEITGTAGSIRTSCFGTSGGDPSAPFGAGSFMLKQGTQSGVHTFPMPDSIQQPLISQIVGELQGQPGVKSPSTAESGARTNWVIEQILE